MKLTVTLKGDDLEIRFSGADPDDNEQLNQMSAVMAGFMRIADVIGDRVGDSETRHRLLDAASEIYTLNSHTQVSEGGAA